MNGWNQEEAWRDAGLYDPLDPGAAERLALLGYLTERGATMEQMVEAHRMGSLPAVAGELVTQGRSGMVTVADLAQHCGLSVSRVLRVLLAAGIPAQSETEVPADLEFVAWRPSRRGRPSWGRRRSSPSRGCWAPPPTTSPRRPSRSSSPSSGRARAASGPDELGRARLAEAATTVFTEVPDVLAHLVMDAFERAQRRAQTARSWLGPGPSADDEAEGPTEVVALGFVDLVGSTAWSETMPLRDQNLALTRFESAAWTSAVLAGGRVIKMIGDEVFFAAPTAEAACRIGLEVCRAAAEDDVLPTGPRGGGHRFRHPAGG